MTRSGRIPLLVVGGGIGGLATALAASQAGLPVHVIEKSENSRSSARDCNWLPTPCGRSTGSDSTRISASTPFSPAAWC